MLTCKLGKKNQYVTIDAKNNKVFRFQRNLNDAENP